MVGHAVSGRTQLKEYCLRRLGFPVLEINVDDDQIEDLIDDAIQYFNERHYNGIERVFLKHKITVEEIYTASDFYHEAHEIIKAVHNRDRTPVFVGGTMMYFKSLLDGMDNLPPRNEEFREFLEERAKSEGLESLYKDLINKDSRYVSSINQKDKKLRN